MDNYVELKNALILLDRVDAVLCNTVEFILLAFRQDEQQVVYLEQINNIRNMIRFLMIDLAYEFKSEKVDL